MVGARSVYVHVSVNGHIVAHRRSHTYGSIVGVDESFPLVIGLDRSRIVGTMER